MNTRKIFLSITFLLALSLACSFFSLPFTTEEDVPPPVEPTAVEEMPAPEQPVPAPPDGAAAIPAASAPAAMDCSLFDVTQFNAIVGTEFTLVTQDQLGSCNYDANGIYRLLIGGGQPVTSEKAQGMFEMTLGSLPGAEWKSYDDGFQLGTAASSVSVTGQGISASGNAILIVAAGDPSSDLDALQETLTTLVQEAARQLNGQW